MSIGERIKAARQAAGINQEQLAKKIGVSKGAIGNYEADISHPKEDILITLMEALNVDANYIYQDYIPTKIAPTEQVSESEEMLLHNYKLLNNQGKKRLIEYSHDLTEIPKYASTDSEEKKPRMVPIRSVARNGLILENEIPEDVANEISEKLKTPHSDFKW